VQRVVTSLKDCVVAVAPHTIWSGHAIAVDCSKMTTNTVLPVAIMTVVVRMTFDVVSVAAAV